MSSDKSPASATGTFKGHSITELKAVEAIIKQAEINAAHALVKMSNDDWERDGPETPGREDVEGSAGVAGRAPAHEGVEDPVARGEPEKNGMDAADVSGTMADKSKQVIFKPGRKPKSKAIRSGLTTKERKREEREKLTKEN